MTLLRDKWTRLMAEVPDIEIRTIAIQPAAAKPDDNASEASSPHSTSSSSSSSSQSHSTMPSSASQLPMRPYLVMDEEQQESDSQAAPDSRRPLAPVPTVPTRSGLKMGLFHKARLKCSGRKQKRKLPEHFYPEIVLPFQHFPDAMTVSMRPVRRPDDGECHGPALRTVELWRRLRAEAAVPVEGDGDAVMLSSLAVPRPSFEADSVHVIDRNTRSLLGILLASIGFESFRSDAMSMLKDLLLHHILATCRELGRRMQRGTEPILPALLHSLLPSPSSAPTDLARLRLYAHSFHPGRQARLQEAVERVIEWRLEQRERAYSMSMAEIDVVHAAPEAYDEQDDGDLDSVALDEEDLMALEPESNGPSPTSMPMSRSMLSADLTMPEPDLDIFGLRDATMSETAMTHELLALPKRTFDISASGLEGTLDPIQFIGEPPLKRLDDD